MQEFQAGFVHTRELRRCIFSRAQAAIIVLLWVYSLRLSGHQVLLVSFHGNQTNESSNKFSQFSSSARGGEPWISSSLENENGEKTSGWMVAHCPVLFLLNLPCAPPPPALPPPRLRSPTLLFPPPFHLSLFFNFSLSPSHFFPIFFSHPPLHLFIFHLSAALDLHECKHIGSWESVVRFTVTEKRDFLFPAEVI